MLQIFSTLSSSSVVLIVHTGPFSYQAMADTLAGPRSTDARSATCTTSYNTTAKLALTSRPMVNGTNDASLRNDFTGAVGYTFTTSSNIVLVTALGYADGTRKGTNGPGLQTTHTVSLWDGSGTLIAAVTVPAGTAGAYAGGYWYATLNSPVTLAANTNFIIAANEIDGGDLWPSSLGNYFPGFSSPAFSGMASLGESNAVFGFDTDNSTPPSQQDGVGTMVWLTCNLLGGIPASVPGGQSAKEMDGGLQSEQHGSSRGAASDRAKSQD